MTTTTDAFLGGRLQVIQPRRGYRAGADPVFMAAAVPARAGETVLELGCGTGVAMLCLLIRVPGVLVTGIEREAATATLARQNLTANDLTASVETADLIALPRHLRDQSFDHVMANPPFFDRSQGSSAKDMGREAGRGAETPLSDWIDCAVRRLAPSGTLTLIQRAERLPECLDALDNRMGDTTVLPFAPRRGKAAKLVVIQSRKGAKGAFRLLAPFELHEGDRHVSDSESYTEAARDILRSGAPLRL